MGLTTFYDINSKCIPTTSHNSMDHDDLNITDNKEPQKAI